MEDIQMNYIQDPSAMLSLWKAFKTRKSVYKTGKVYPIVHATRSNLTINESHLRAFHAVCGVEFNGFLHPLYPFTLAYPYIMRVLSTREVPISMFKVLNTRNSMVIHRPISPREKVDIHCHNTLPRIVSRGLEIDVSSVISSEGEPCWGNTATYFYPGQFGQADPSFTAPILQPLQNAPVIAEWHLHARDRFRFARISGDTNGIHYWYYYARMLGFKRDFAQPIRVVARCVSSVPDIDLSGRLKVEFHLKGPVYYESDLILKGRKTGEVSLFDLYASGNDRPVIRGAIES